MVMTGFYINEDITRFRCSNEVDDVIFLTKNLKNLKISNEELY